MKKKCHKVHQQQFSHKLFIVLFVYPINIVVTLIGQRQFVINYKLKDHGQKLKFWVFRIFFTFHAYLKLGQVK